MQYKNLLQGAIWLSFSHIFSRGTLIIATMILSRYFENIDFAAYSYFQLTISTLSAYASMGVGVIATKQFAERAHNNKKGEEAGVLWKLSFLMGFSILFISLITPNEPSVHALPIPNWMIGVGVFSIVIGVVPANGVIGLERYALTAICAAASGVILIAGIIYACYYESLLVAMLSLVAANITQAIGNTATILKDKELRLHLWNSKLCVKNIRLIFGQIGPLFFVSIMAASGAWLVGRIILSGSSAEKGFSLYAIGIQWFSLAMFLPGIVSRVLMPQMIRLQSTKSTINPKGINLARQGIILTVATASIIALCGVIASPWLVKLYGVYGNDERWFFSAFLLAAVFSAPANTIGNSIVVDGGHGTWFKISLIWLISLIFIATTAFDVGHWAGAFAYLCSYALLSALAILVARKRGLI